MNDIPKPPTPNYELQTLNSELERLKVELEEAREKARTAEEGRQAMLLMLEDLNEATAGMEKAKKEWEATFDSISDPLFIHDKKMMLVRANSAYLSASGEAKFRDIIGRPYYEVFPKMEGPFRMCMKAQEMQEEAAEEEFSCPLTNRIFKVRFYPIKDVNGAYLYSIHILEDITEAKRAEERIKRHVDELERFKKATIKRELRMKDMRDRLEELERKLGVSSNSFG